MFVFLGTRTRLIRGFPKLYLARSTTTPTTEKTHQYTYIALPSYPETIPGRVKERKMGGRRGPWDTNPSHTGFFRILLCGGLRRPPLKKLPLKDSLAKRVDVYAYETKFFYRPFYAFGYSFFILCKKIILRGVQPVQCKTFYGYKCFLSRGGFHSISKGVSFVLPKPNIVRSRGLSVKYLTTPFLTVSSFKQTK